MSTVTPPAPPPPPLPPAPAPLVTVQNPPVALLKLALGAELLATVARSPSGGMLELESPLGRFLIQPVPALPKAGVVTLLLQTLEPRPQFLITAVNGAPVQSAAQTAGETGNVRTGQLPAPGPRQTEQPRVTAPAPGPRQPSVNLNPGRQIGATALPRSVYTPLATVAGATGPETAVLRAGAPRGPVAAPGQGIAQGNLTQLRSSLGKLTAPPGAAGQPQQAGSPTHAGPSGGALRTLALQSGLSSSVASVAAPASADFPPGTQMQVRVVSVGQNVAAAARQGPAPGLILNGIAAGRTPTGLPVIQTSKGYLALDTRAEIPNGTRVTVEVRQVRQPLRPLPATLATAQVPSATLGPWTNLEEAVVALREVSPMLAEQMVRSALPRPDGGLAAAILVILSAIRGRSLPGFIGGPALRTLDRINPDLAKRLGDDFQRISGTVSDPATGDWRYALLPINLGTTIQRIRLMMKQRDRKKAKNRDDPAGTRFILDFELSALGRMQFDGLSKDEQRHLDLIIRTTAPLPNPLRAGISDVFSTTLSDYGLSGQLAYQGKAKFVDIHGPFTTLDGLSAGDLSQLLV